MSVLAVVPPVNLPSCVFAGGDDEPASSVSEHLQSRDGDGVNWNGLGEFLPGRTNINLQEKIKK